MKKVRGLFSWLHPWLFTAACLFRLITKRFDAEPTAGLPGVYFSAWCAIGQFEQ